MTSVSAILEGFALGASLIVAIGAQNAFVLRQGIKREHVFATAAFCAFADLLLIVAGALGLGSLIASLPLLLKIITFAGAAFVLWYGVKAFIRVFRAESLQAADADGPSRLGAALRTLLLLTFLNPHVYLDTVLLLGGVSSRYPLPERFGFVAGACLASITWFFGLAFGARALAPVFKKRRTWQIFDCVIGVLMVIIAVQLVLFGVGVK